MSLQIRLPYLGTNAEGISNKSPMGYNEISEVSNYNNASLRNVRVVRVDLIKYLTEHFSFESMVKYRTFLYYIIAGYGMDTKESKQAIANGLESLYKEDEVFRMKMGKIVYFRDSKYEGLSVFDALLQDINRSLFLALNDVNSKVPYTKIICDSYLYYYYSVNLNIPVNKLLEIKGLEVVSR